MGVVEGRCGIVCTGGFRGKEEASGNKEASGNRGLELQRMEVFAKVKCLLR